MSLLRSPVIESPPSSAPGREHTVSTHGLPFRRFRPMQLLVTGVLALVLGACSDPVDPFLAYRDARYHEARAGFERLAAEGDLHAVNALGVIHLLGLTGPRDPERAADLFFKAAVGGVADAQRNVGGLYERGETVRKNLPLAYGWYDLASRNGHEVARVHAESIGAQLSANMAKQGRERVQEVLRGVREPER